MKANDYEVLISKVYDKGNIHDGSRHLVMQREYNRLQKEVGSGVVSKNDFKLKKSFLIVRNYVQQTINDGLKHFKFNMVNEDITKLNYMAAILNRNFFDKSSLDQIIVRANLVFSQYN